ncbi:MAG: ATP-binding protein, partial [Elainellaceae cyanobacterium]
QERSIDIHYDRQAVSWVVADATALREVLNNLLDNAVKYTPVGGYIEVRSGIVMSNADDDQQADDWQAIVIADTGPGIPLGDQRHLFERHFRGVQADGDIPGTGLGLAIARELIQQMNGRLAVFSPAVESCLLSRQYLSQHADASPGTAVVIQLPIAKPAED